MKKYASILCIFTMSYMLLTNCTKATVAQIAFSASLATDTAKIQGYRTSGTGGVSISVRAKYFPILINIVATEKAVALYPKAQLYLGYTIYDQQGNEMVDTYLYQFTDNKLGTLFTDFFQKLAPNLPQPIGHQNLSSTINNKTTYNIVRVGNDTLSTTPYKIKFTLVVFDSSKNESLPVITPKEAHRTLDVIINPNNPNQASYILTYNKKLFYLPRRIDQEALETYLTRKKDYYNDYFKIIS